MDKQLDLFSSPKREPSESEWEKVFESKSSKPKKQGSFSVVTDPAMPKDRGMVGRIANTGIEPIRKEYGDEYLAKGIARWSVYCFLWLSENRKVCAPYFGDSHDKGWKPRWVDTKQAKEMLEVAHYYSNSIYTNTIPGTQKRAKAIVYRFPTDGALERLRIEAKKKESDEDLRLLPPIIGMDSDKADEFYQLLRAMRRSAEKDEIYRLSVERQRTKGE